MLVELLSINTFAASADTVPVKEQMRPTRLRFTGPARLIQSGFYRLKHMGFGRSRDEQLDEWARRHGAGNNHSRLDYFPNQSNNRTKS